MFRFGNHITGEAITNIDPKKKILTSSSGAQWSYDQLVLCPGIQNDYG
jgi:NADPH-dependent 2,4-dienoyl-CoA reductase/sulfur reductase-like enzyme